MTFLRGALFLSLQALASFCYTFNATLLPKDPFLLIGMKLVLTCQIDDSETRQSLPDLRVWRCDGRPLPEAETTSLGVGTLRFDMKIRRLDDAGPYCCWSGDGTGRRQLLATQEVKVDYETTSISNARCMIFEWESMNCTWKLGRQYVYPEYIKVSTFWTLNMKTFYRCSEQRNMLCYIKKGLADFSMNVYLYFVVNNTKVGSVNTSAISVLSKTVVKLSPVERVNSSANSTCLSLSWDYHYSDEKLVYRVTYVSKWDRTTKSFNTRRTLNSACGLIPFTKYNVTISAKLTDSVYWSESKVLRAWTQRAVPNIAPKITRGGFTEGTCEPGKVGHRSVIIYWQVIDSIMKNDEKVWYRVTYSAPGSTAQVMENVAMKIKLCRLRSDKRYRVEIRTVNTKGESDDAASLYLNPGNVVPTPQNFEVIMEDSPPVTLVTMKWEQPPVITGVLSGYTVYHCLGSRQHGCSSGFGWTHIPITNTSFHATKNSSLENHLFGISAESERGSSGIYWSSCSYFTNKVPTKSVIATFLDDPADRSLSVTWNRVPCEEDPAYIEKYHVCYCLSDASSGCIDKEKSIEMRRNLTVAVIGDLEPGQKYLVWIEASTSTKRVSVSEPVVQVVADNSLQPGLVMVVIGCALIMFFVGVGIFVISRKCKQIIQQCSDPLGINFPEIKQDDLQIMDTKNPMSKNSLSNNYLHDRIFEKKTTAVTELDVGDEALRSATESTLSTGKINNALNSGYAHLNFSAQMDQKETKPFDILIDSIEQENNDIGIVRSEPSNLSSSCHLHTQNDQSPAGSENNRCSGSEQRDGLGKSPGYIPVEQVFACSIDSQNLNSKSGLQKEESSPQPDFGINDCTDGKNSTW